MQRLLTILLIAFGLLLGLTGLGFIAMYVYSALIDRIGDADQSLLFWLLPILFAGIGLSGSGALLLRLGLRRRRAAAERLDRRR
jgi:apolipoprotein N-acyltransferase